jgi:transposase InsO family protein
VNKYSWIKDQRDQFPLTLLCDVLEVSRSAFYEWLENPVRAREQYRQTLVSQIRELREEPYLDTYGSPRVTEELKARGVEVCENTIAKVMNEADIKANTARRFVPCTTDSAHAFQVPDNTLDRDFGATGPNQKWVCDITYIPTDQGWLYLAGVMDCFSRKIVGWSMSKRMPAELVSDALTMAIARRQPQAGLLHHSDRGVQYACDHYQALLKAHGIVCSMSRAGDCYDNAMKESFWSTLKREALNGRHFKTIEDARAAVFEYIETFYNRKRRHSSLGYMSPECFEASRN